MPHHRKAANRQAVKKLKNLIFGALIWPSIHSYWACVVTLFLGGVD
jgi:hypothetical protein